MFCCESCGAGLRFDPASQKLVCRSCGASVSVKDFRGREAMRAKEQELSEEEAAFYQNPEEQAQKNDAYEPIFSDGKAAASGSSNSETWQAVLMTCPQCGGQLLTADETAATFCSFCGASVLLESRVSREKMPKLIIPFQMTKEDCAQAYRKKLKQAIYIPKDMKSEEQIERFRGIYMPYWVYSYSKEGELAVPGKKTTRRGDYLYIDHFSLRSPVKASYRGISYDASASFSDNLSEAIAPFDYKKKEDFDEAYLSGFYADTADVPEYLYAGEAKEAAEEHMARTILQSPVYRAYEVDEKAAARSMNLQGGKPELAFYPVWFLASRNRAGNRVSYAVVNGQTGEIAADLPVDQKKLLIGTLILAVPIFLILNLALTMTPTKVLIIVLLLGFASLFLTNRQMNLIYCFENRLDDKGYQSKVQLWDSPGTAERKKKGAPPSKPPISRKGGISILLIVLFFVLLTLGSAVGAEGITMLGYLFFIILILHQIRPESRAGKGTKGGGKAANVSYTAPLKDKMKLLWKSIAGLIAGLVILILDPVSDIYYYAGCVVAMVFVAWSFWDILGLHNRLATRPLPQFEKRGGEEFENQ